MNKNNTVVHIIMLVVLAMTSCSKKPSLFKDLSCEPPCWQGMTPGETTKINFGKFLNDSPIVENESIFERVSYGIFQTETGFTLTSGAEGGAFFIDYVLSDLYFSDHIGMTLQDAVEFYGEPKFLLVYLGWCNPVPFTFGDPQCMQINAFNPDIGIEYGFQTSKIVNIKIDENVNLTHIEFFDPKMYEVMLEEGVFAGLEKDVFIEHIKPWTGYGELQDK
jgi:hypothetical protein